MGISLVGGWLPVLLVSGAVSSLAGSVGWRSRRWRATAAALAGLAVVVTAVIRFEVTANRLIEPPLPLVDWSWVAAVVFAVAVALGGWRSGGLRHRVLAPVSVVLTLAMAAALFNAAYGYFPTVGSLVTPTAHQVSAQQVEALVHPRHDIRRVVALTLPRHGVTFEVRIPGTVSGFRARSAWVYLPPAWFATPRPRLPVVMLLEGTPATTVDWFRAGLADRTADRFAARHGGMAPILVLPDENGSFLADTECLDRPHARAETYLTVDVRRFVIRHYGAASNPSAWAVAGLSEGGTCAFDLALRHSDLFRSFGDYSGDPAPSAARPAQTLAALFLGNAAREASYQPAYLLAHRPRSRAIGGWFEVGRGDGRRLVTARALARMAARSGIAARWATVPGQHSYAVWSQSFASSLGWFWSRFRPAPAPPLVDLTTTVTRRPAPTSGGRPRDRDASRPRPSPQPPTAVRAPTA